VAARIASPHHDPSASQPSDLHARRISRKLTIGINPPIDFSGSVIHMSHSAEQAELIAKRPALPSKTATTTPETVRRPSAARSSRTRGLSADVRGAVDIFQSYGLRNDVQSVIGG